MRTATLSIDDIIIDPEFRDLLPEVEDSSRLRGKIELEGWSDEPITVWQGHNILLDGHRRYGIWKERGDDGPQIRELEFASREAAYHWVVNNQCARRNLTPEQQRYLLGRKYTAERGIRGGTGANQHTVKEQNGETHLSAKGENDTRKRVADEAGVTEWEVRQSYKYADAVDALDRRGVVAKGEILSGSVKARPSKVIAASQAESDEEARCILTGKEKPPSIETSDATEPFKLNGERAVNVANKNYKRLGILFGQVQAIADGIEAIKLDAAMSVLKKHDADEWIEDAKRTIAALTALSKRLKKESERARLSETSEETED